MSECQVLCAVAMVFFAVLFYVCLPNDPSGSDVEDTYPPDWF